MVRLTQLISLSQEVKTACANAILTVDLYIGM